MVLLIFFVLSHAGQTRNGFIIYMVLPKELLSFVCFSHDANFESFRTDSRGLGARDNGPRQTHR